MSKRSITIVQIYCYELQVVESKGALRLDRANGHKQAVLLCNGTNIRSYQALQCAYTTKQADLMKHQHWLTAERATAMLFCTVAAGACTCRGCSDHATAGCSE
eukprot:18598-Heterococcus_DN1.PRE.1